MTANPRIVAFAWGMAFLCTAVGVGVVLSDAPAYEVPASEIRPPLSKPGPPVPDTVEGDGTYVVGKQIQRGVYQNAGGPRCTWTRLTDLTGTAGSVYDRGTSPGRITLSLPEPVVAFETHGCAEWVMVR
ncbi:MAG TPA: hypothetical protein VIP77_12080 [Jiangellaceae bacterium]